VEDWLRRPRRLVSGLRRWQRWLVVLCLSCAAVAVTIIATAAPKGLIAAGLVAAAAVATIGVAVGPPVARFLRKGPALKVPDTPVSRSDAYDLGVHPAVLREEHDADRSGLTPYLRRSHDTELDRDIMQAAAGGRSIFTVLVGQSATGKTRALFEALSRDTAVRDWPLFRPADGGELATLLTQQRIGRRTALWLNETQQYLFGKSGPEAARLLTRLLTSTTGIIVVGAMWPGYWTDLTQRGVAGDPDAAARELLEGPATHRIDVADHLGEAEVQELAASGRSDRRLAAAVAAAGTGGQVIQNLTGGPELLARYLDGSLFSPIEHALITAALDARRLGHESPLPADLLTAAADGYVTDSQRPDPTAWAAALTAITGGKRADAHNTPTDVRTLTALTTRRARGQTDPHYQPSDYLDQNTRQLRQASMGPAALWDALAAHAASAEDLTRLAQAAGDRGLYRHAAALWTTAATPGNAYATRELIIYLSQVSPGDTTRAARWAAAHVGLDNLGDVARLLPLLGEAGDRNAVTALADRAAGHAGLDSPRDIVLLLTALRIVGNLDAVTALLARDPARHASLDSPEGVGLLLDQLLKAEDHHAVTALLARDPARHASLDSPEGVGLLLEVLRKAGDADAVSRLAARTARHASLDNPWRVLLLLEQLAEAGEPKAVTVLAARAARHAGLEDPGDIVLPALENAQLAALVQELESASGRDAVSALLASAEYVLRDNPWDDLADTAALVQELAEAAGPDAVAAELAKYPAGLLRLDNPAILKLLWSALDSDAVTALRARSRAEYASPDNPAYIAEELAEAENPDAVTALLAREPAEHARLDNPRGVALLLEALRKAGDPDAACALAVRAANGGMFNLFLETYPDEASRYRFGRDPDGAPSQPWKWQEPTS
jgi:hypothetical protein